MTVFFPDVSHFQAGLSLKGAAAVIAKATQSTTFVDSAYAGFKAQAAALGIPFLPYHYLAHGRIAAQVAHVVATIGRRTIMLDVEEEAGGDPQLADVYGFTDGYAAAGGRVVLGYIPHWFWDGHWGRPSLTGLTQRSVSLISSEYPAEGYTEDGPGWAPYGGVTPVQWQYTSSHPFNGMKVDFNAYKGTVQQLAALFGGTAVPVLDNTDLNNIAKTIAGWNVAPSSDPPRGWGGAEWDGRIAAKNAETLGQQTLEAVHALGAPPVIDVDALAAALAPKVVAGLVNDANFLAAVAKAVNNETAFRLTT